VIDFLHFTLMRSVDLLVAFWKCLWSILAIVGAGWVCIGLCFVIAAHPLISAIIAACLAVCLWLFFCFMKWREEIEGRYHALYVQMLNGAWERNE
jgi:hypothetical protein